MLSSVLCQDDTSRDRDRNSAIWPLPGDRLLLLVPVGATKRERTEKREGGVNHYRKVYVAPVKRSVWGFFSHMARLCETSSRDKGKWETLSFISPAACLSAMTLGYIRWHLALSKRSAMEAGNHTVVYFSEQVVVLFSCALSFLGSSLIILTYIIWSDLRTTPRKLLVFLSVSDWLSAVSYGYGVWRVFRNESLDCIIQGAISTFANSSSFFWTVAIAVYLYIFIVRSSQRVADNLVLFFHLVR